MPATGKILGNLVAARPIPSPTAARGLSSPGGMRKSPSRSPTMCPLLILLTSLVAPEPAVTPGPVAGLRDAYRAEKAKAGADAAGQVRLALWCESRGLEAEKVEHLAR